jgi:transcriptional regulator with XRE-family HTH domain
LIDYGFSIGYTPDKQGACYILNIGEKLKQARMDANMTQEALAEMLSVSRQTISNWENGRSYPDIASIIVLSDVYGMTLDSLLKGDDEMIKHIKESTDTVKSNKQVIKSLIALAVFFVFAYVFTAYRFVPVPRIFILGVIILIAGVLVFHLFRQTPFDKAKEAQSEQGVNDNHDIS